VASDVPEELDVFERQEPVRVVDHQGPALPEIQILGKLPLDGLGVFFDLLPREDLAHLGLAAGVADHGRPAAHERNGAVAGPLHVGEGHDGHEAPDVEARGRRVEPDVAGHLLACQDPAGLGLVGHLLDEASLRHDIIDALHKTTAKLRSEEGGKIRKK